MNDVADHAIATSIDPIQERLADYAFGVTYDEIPPQARHALKVRFIDTVGALFGGFFGAPCRVARNVAAQRPDAAGATVIGTRTKTTPELAAFANATASRYIEANDVYHWPDSTPGHPSDVLLPVFAVAEHAGVSGRDFIAAGVLAYEVYVRMCDVGRTPGFDAANLSCLATAIAAGKLLGLSREQMSHCISMVTVTSNMLRQVRTGHLSVWKAVAAGEAGRAGVFAATLARAGMEGPNLPFVGKNGWCNHVAGKTFSLDVMGGGRVPFKVDDTLIKQRASCATTISSILAAEKIAPIADVARVAKVTVEVGRHAKEGKATGEHHWNPDSKETADHSIPYVTAATLVDGTITPHSFTDGRIFDAALRRLLQKVEVVTDEAFTRVYDQVPIVHAARVTVLLDNGERLVGESGGDLGDLSQPKTDAEISDKFRGFTESYLGARAVSTLLERLWALDECDNVASLPPSLILD